MEHPSDRLFERATYAEGLSNESIKQLEAVVQERAMAALVEINKMAFELAQADKSKQDAKHRFRFGAYFYKTEIDSLGTAETPAKKKPIKKAAM